MSTREQTEGLLKTLLELSELVGMNKVLAEHPSMTHEQQEATKLKIEAINALLAKTKATFLSSCIPG